MTQPHVGRTARCLGAPGVRFQDRPVGFGSLLLHPFQKRGAEVEADELQGIHDVGDAAFSAPIGDVGGEAMSLLEVTERALEVGIEMMRPGNRTGDVSHAIQQHVETRGFSVVREYTGHGVGRRMWEQPQVPNYGSPGRGARLRPGMTIALEPMVNQGAPGTRVLSDQWTVATADGKPCAHFEHTIAVTRDGPVILTLP